MRLDNAPLDDISDENRENSLHQRTHVTGCPPDVLSGSKRESGASLGLAQGTSRSSVSTEAVNFIIPCLFWIGSRNKTTFSSIWS